MKTYRVKSLIYFAAFLLSISMYYFSGINQDGNQKAIESQLVQSDVEPADTKEEIKTNQNLAL